MRFRPCIDIHNGKVKQIVGGSLRDAGSRAGASGTVCENFVSEKDASWYASFYREKGLTGGHVILLDPEGSPMREATLAQARAALAAWPGGLQAGGGVTAENASAFLDAGASHVIVTSYVFREGKIDRERLDALVREVGKEHLVLDLSCRRYLPGMRDGTGGPEDPEFRVVTDRWQTFTRERVTPELLEELAGSCAEFLIHAADVEGRAAGIEDALIRILAQGPEIPVTYAGGAAGEADIRKIREVGHGRIDVTVGSALRLFGGPLELEDVLRWCTD